MGWCVGGSAIEEGLQKLQEALQNYHGTLNELRLGQNVPPPEKPEAKVLWDRCKTLGMPLIEGGLLTQPYIWMQEVAVVIEVDSLFEVLNARNSESRE